MSLKDTFFGKKLDEAPIPPKQEIPNRVKGRIYHLNVKPPPEGGYGFIETEEIPRERIYFHWKSLNHNTRKFDDLKNGDIVEFTPRKYDEKKGWVALRVQVVE